MARDRNDLVILGDEECWRLLRTNDVHVGRVAFIEDGRPRILPVNYLVDRESVVFRTDADGSLAAIEIGQPLSFEADHADPTWEEGWSVVVHGEAAPLEGDARDVPVRAWAGGDKSVLVRIAPKEISGRRLI